MVEIVEDWRFYCLRSSKLEVRTLNFNYIKLKRVLKQEAKIDCDGEEIKMIKGGAWTC
jgi:hypothetical protein